MRIWLQNIRKEKGYSMQEIADLVGISKGYYCFVEGGKRTPSGYVGRRIAEKLEFDMKHFYIEQEVSEMKQIAE